jgi:alanyl-tRNA synthetase
MRPMNSVEIREKFLSFFEENDHLKIKSSSILPHNDPTLLFINSGMAPLKPYFLGKETPPSPRLCNIQPCIRTKDIDDVGDRHHLTLFEMLGSWSIGDYYKERAVELAWKLLTEGFEMDPEKLYVSVYEGDKSLGLGPDEVSAKAWEKVGVKKDHIIRLGADNFWGPAGETGPCGPCTEVFYDTGPEHGEAYVEGGEFDTVHRYIEIWNAGVFMELNKLGPTKYEPLEIKSVDTGSGLERMAMIMNGLESVYETDVFKPVMDMLSEKYSLGESKNRVLADHLRAASFILSEGVIPSNEGQGYIPRRLIRKCVAVINSAGVEKIDFTTELNSLIDAQGDFYPMLKRNKELVIHNINEEISDFLPIIQTGREKIESILKNIKKGPFPGKEAFELVTTHGLPLDVLIHELSEKKIELNTEEYEECFQTHRNISRVVKANGASEAGAMEEIEKNIPHSHESQFTGYQSLKEDAKITHLLNAQGKITKSIQENESFSFTTDKTPFYAESGGQAGDTGLGKGNDGTFHIVDTLKVHNSFVHFAVMTSGTLKDNETVSLNVSEPQRKETQANHSATHLLHSALHHILGSHCVQKGSLVNSEKLRFDFAHGKKVTPEEVKKIEDFVNQRIIHNTNNNTEVMKYDDAIKTDAMALFGENYGDLVRVVKLCDDSVEFCGGTHVEKTGDIGPFIITAETSVAKGIRRLEGLTGLKALEKIQKRNSLILSLNNELSANEDNLIEKLKDLKKKLKEAQQNKTSSSQNTTTIIKEKTITFDDKSQFYIGLLEGGIDLIKNAGDVLLDKKKAPIICLLGLEEDKLKACVWVEKELTKTYKAGSLIKDILKPLNGKGGGRPQFAQGGGDNVKGLDVIFSESWGPSL